MFVWDRDELNGEQEAAILAPGNVLLIACPGSGKTRALTYKIALELSKLKSKKKFIIAITYTNNAAEEIKTRIEHLGEDTSQLWIGTIHSFCTEWILRPYGLYDDALKYGFKVLNSHESEALLDTFCAPYKVFKVSYYDCSYIFTKTGYALGNCAAVKRPYVEDVLKNYWAYLKANRFIDFELILKHTYELIQTRPVIAKTLSKLFSYILLDEFQDTKELQYEVLASIIASNPKEIGSFIVGDPNQSIFTGLGGYAIALEDLQNMTKSKFEPFELSNNFRSSERLIKYFQHYKTFPNTILAAGKNKDYTSIISLNQEVMKSVLEDEIVRLLAFNITEKGISPNEICIVGPQWVHLSALTRNLMVKMPDYNFNGPGMAPFARDIDNFFYKICRIVLTEPSPAMYITRMRWSREILKDLHEIGSDISGTSAKAFLRHSNLLRIDETDGLAYLKIAFSELLASLGVDKSMYKALTEDYNSFFASSEQRIKKLAEQGDLGVSTIVNFRKVFKQRDGITISTMHGVKGLEFDVVIAFGLLEDWVPHFSDVDGENSAKKLLYVIASRARLNLHMISERREKRFSRPPRNMFSTNQLSGYVFGYDNC
ncbi:ATP-dependent DNA helicase [Pedobacter sp. Leaf216]|uniref:UvrD-helicase domain-containing protein n=1 Tax=Pedobacter sp. Leaf216 TaxID=1735684 RepID=UPI0006FA41D8|nr:ATP-dependent helicase [Pedobacter sp. Leaf216]KQM79198.1 ATP-dependent DNA helicase [Pedobacter sp. Leaf216]